MDRMHIAIIAATTLALISSSSLADVIHINCQNDKEYYECETDGLACRARQLDPAVYRFTLDLKMKTGSLVYCTSEWCLDPSPLVILKDHSAFLQDYGEGSLKVGITVWEEVQEATYAITLTRYVRTITSCTRG